MGKKLSVLFGVFLFFIASATALSGSGTESDPYLVSSAEDFTEMCLIYDGQGYFQQTQDIFMGQGFSYGGCSFGGTYDGQFYEIDTPVDALGSGGGIFTGIDGDATIKNWYIKDPSIRAGSETVGGVIAPTFTSSGTMTVRNLTIIGGVVNASYPSAGLMGDIVFGGPGGTIDVENVFIKDLELAGDEMYSGYVIGGGEMDDASSFKNVWGFNNVFSNGNDADIFGSMTINSPTFQNMFNANGDTYWSTQYSGMYGFTPTEVRDGSYISAMGETESSWYGDNPIYQRSIPLTGYEEPATGGMPMIEGFDKSPPILQLASKYFKNLDREGYEGNDFLSGDTIRMSQTIEETGDFQYGIGEVDNIFGNAVIDNTTYDNLSKSDNFDSSPQQSVTINLTFDANDNSYDSSSFRHEFKINESSLHLLDGTETKSSSSGYIEGERFGGTFNYDEEMKGDKAGYWVDGQGFGFEDEVTWSGSFDDDTEGAEVLIDSYQSDGIPDNVVGGDTEDEVFGYPDSAVNTFYFEGENTVTANITYYETYNTSTGEIENGFTITNQTVNIEVVDSRNAEFEVSDVNFENHDYGGQEIKIAPICSDCVTEKSDYIVSDFDVQYSGNETLEFKRSEINRYYKVLQEDGSKFLHPNVDWQNFDRKDGVIEINGSEGASFDFDEVNELGVFKAVNWENQGQDVNYADDVKIEFRETGSNNVVDSFTIEPVAFENKTYQINQFMDNLNTNQNYNVVAKRVVEGTTTTIGTSSIIIEDVPADWRPLPDLLDDATTTEVEIFKIYRDTTHEFGDGIDMVFDIDREDITGITPDSPVAFFESYIPNSQIDHGFTFKPEFKAEYSNFTIVDDFVSDEDAITVDSAVDYTFDFNSNPSTSAVTVNFEFQENMSSVRVAIVNSVGDTIKEAYLSDFTQDEDNYEYVFENVSTGTYDLEYSIEDEIGNVDSGSIEFMMPYSDKWSELKGWTSQYTGMDFHMIGFIMTIMFTFTTALFSHLITGNFGKGFPSRHIPVGVAIATVMFCFITGILSGSTYAGTVAIILGAYGSFRFGSW